MTKSLPALINELENALETLSDDGPERIQEYQFNEDIQYCYDSDGRPAGHSIEGREVSITFFDRAYNLWEVRKKE